MQEKDVEEMAATRRSESAARLVSARQDGGFASLAGAWRGRVKIGGDFDGLPADLAESLGVER